MVKKLNREVFFREKVRGAIWNSTGCYVYLALAIEGVYGMT
jgi:hypothetical protein